MTAEARLRKIAGLAWHQAERAVDAADRRWRKWTGASRRDESLHWSRRRAGMLTWQDHPSIRAHINRRVSGDEDINWLACFARDFGKGFPRALNLGSGFGDLEEHAFSAGIAKSFLSLDISEQAITFARKRLSGYSVEFQVADANTVELDSDSLDVAFAASSLHHLTDLEHALEQIKQALKPGGFLVFDEYVGPSRFQWTAVQLDIVNEILAALPARYRRDLRRWGRLKKRIYPAPLDERDRNSPCEAFRSSEILDLVGSRFKILVRRDYGGAILHPLLDGIAGNFRTGNEEDMALLDKLIKLEMKLETSGIIGSDFTHVVAQKP